MTVVSKATQPTRTRPDHGSDGRCPNCGSLLENTSKKFATCPNGDMRLVPAFPSSFLAKVASGAPTATRLQRNGSRYTYKIDGRPNVYGRSKNGTIVAWEVIFSPIRQVERWQERRFVCIQGAKLPEGA